MGPGLVAHLGAALVVLAVGVMLLAVGSLATGGVLTGGAGLWLGWGLRRISRAEDEDEDGT